jgi:hypothetical protein
MADCFARAASRQVAAPPSSAMNPRCLTRSPRRRAAGARPVSDLRPELKCPVVKGFGPPAGRAAYQGRIAHLAERAVGLHPHSLPAPQSGRANEFSWFDAQRASVSAHIRLIMAGSVRGAPVPTPKEGRRNLSKSLEAATFSSTREALKKSPVETGLEVRYANGGEGSCPAEANFKIKSPCGRRPGSRLRTRSIGVARGGHAPGPRDS